MYVLIDEILVSPKQEQIFLSHRQKFALLYQQIRGVRSVHYYKATLEAFKKSRGRERFGIGARHLSITKNPKGAYLLIIIFKSQADFQNYHDNSSIAKEIHQKIASYFDGKQLTIRSALHGEELLNDGRQ